MLLGESPTRNQNGTALASVFALQHAESAVVVLLPRVPSFEGPNSVCVSGLIECSHLNCERHRADTEVIIVDCVCRFKHFVNKLCRGGVVHRFNFSLRLDYRGLKFHGERVVARGPASLCF